MSQPSRVRGLKFGTTGLCADTLHTVAPFTGAWIEIPGANYKRKSFFRSHPSRVRGLKYRVNVKACFLGKVAPFTGAWIEICDTCGLVRLILMVAPFTGAWIEIRASDYTHL